MVAKFLIGDPNENSDNHESISIKLLVAHLLCGSIIGKAGVNIKEIQSKTNAKIVVSRETLPECNDRTVEVTAFPSAM